MSQRPAQRTHQRHDESQLRRELGQHELRSHRRLNGVLYRGGPFSVAASAAQPFKGKTLADILDGTSNTMMVAEVLQGRNADLRGFTWWGDATQFSAYLPPNSALPDRIYAAGYCVNLPDLNLPCAVSDTANPTMFASRSRHPGGVQVVMCDGATRFVAESIDLDVWRAASTIEGAEALSLP